MQQASFAPAAKQQPRPNQQTFAQPQAASSAFNQSSPVYGQMQQKQQQQGAFGAQQQQSLGFGAQQQSFAPQAASVDPFSAFDGLQNMSGLTAPAPATASATASPSATNAFATSGAQQPPQLPSPVAAAFASPVKGIPAPKQTEIPAIPSGPTAMTQTPLSPASMPASNLTGPMSPISLSAGSSSLPVPTTFAPALVTAQPQQMSPVKLSMGTNTGSAPLSSPKTTASQGSHVRSPVTARSPVSPPAQASMAEKKARRLREEESARQKSMMQKEKKELAKEREQMTSGIGSSGASFDAAGSGGVEAGFGGGMSSGGPGFAEPRFNPYDFLAGTRGKLPSRKFSPIFRVPPFFGLMTLENYVRRFPLSKEKLSDRAEAYQQLAKALSFLCHVVAESRGQLAYLKHNHLACEACIKLMSVLPHSAGASGKTLDGMFLNFINVFIPIMEKLEPNQQLVLPGGWQQPDSFHICLYIIRNCGSDKWSFTVCNTGKDGLEYHPSTFDSETGKEQKQLALTVWNIPSKQLMDSSFWAVLFRMQIYPSKRNSAHFLYTKLLPSLNSQPLRSNLDQGPADYWDVPDPISASTYHPLAKLALTTTPQSGCRTSKHSSLLLMNTAVNMSYAEIEHAPASSLDPEDTRILKLTGRNLANFASTLSSTTVGDGTLGQALSSSWELLDKLHKKINFTSAKPLDQYSHGLSKSALSDEFSQGMIKTMRAEAGSVAFPLFGRLRRDDYENVVKKLMGDPRPDPILIPAVLTDEELPPMATDFMTAASGLQRIADACSLLLQQRRLIKNAPAFAASAAQYAITVVLPMPNSDPKYCFWRKTEMRRETQLNILFLLRRICRIYSAATACVQQSRGLVAIRSITFGCAACVADAICRIKACDDPSAFAMHYSGQSEGPTQPFAIEAGSFDTLGSNLPIYDPNLCSLRFRCLDYLRGTTYSKSGMKRDTIFNFDATLVPMGGDLTLMNQLSIQLALVRPYPPTDEAMINHSAKLISGRNGSIIEVLPEFEYFRDIVFHFKHAVSGKTPTADVKDSKKTRAWVPADATLHWNVQKGEKDDPRLYLHVAAFDDHPQGFVDYVAQAPKHENKFRGFLSLFTSKQKAVRARLSSADPTTVVNSCGDKFQQKRYVSVYSFKFLFINTSVFLIRIARFLY
jgi:hypothetical protein